MAIDPNLEKSMSVLQQVVQRVEEGQQRLREHDQELSARYKRNMDLFAAVMPHIYEEFKAYQPKNKAVFLEENGELNLYDSSLGTALFFKTPSKSCSERVQKFLSQPLKTSLGLSRRDHHPSRHVHYGNIMRALLRDVDDQYERPSGVPEFVPAMVMFGLELGYQLAELVQQRDIKHLYIYERNLDYFYYSLFAIEWLPILEHFNRDGHTINFQLGVPAESLTDVYLLQLEENGFFWAPETYLYLGYKSPELDESMEAFRKNYPRQAMGWGFFDDALIGIAQGMRAISKMNLCVLDRDKKLPRWQQDVPVFILGNGPSLDDGIELLKEVRDQVLLISCGSTINTLKRVGIQPDFQVDVERMKQTVDKFTFFDKDELQDIVGLTVDVMHPDFYSYFDRTITGGKPGEAVVTLIGAEFAAQGMSYMQMNHSAPFVANLALSYCHYFGFRNIYFLGVDNGYFDSENHHSKFSGYYKDGKDSGFQSFKVTRTVPLPGNFGGEVRATNYMNMSKVQLEALLAFMHKQGGLNCFNLSRGAKMEGATPLPIDDVLILDPPINKDAIVSSLIETFTTKAPASLTERKPEEMLHVKDFLYMVNLIKQSWTEEISTKAQLCHMLWKNHRHIYLLKATNHRYIYDLLKGSYTSSAFMVLSVIARIEDESEAVMKAREMWNIWLEFLDEMPSMLQQASNFIDQGDDHLIKNYNG